MGDAIARYVHDGDTVAIEGFTAFICFAAAHEIIRQGRRDLTLCRMTPDLVYDQMVAAGCARKLIFGYLGNPGVGPLYCIRRAVEKGIPQPLEIEEYSHFGMICRYMAGAAKLPFFPLRSYLGADLAKVNPRIAFVQSPYGGAGRSRHPRLRAAASGHRYGHLPLRCGLRRDDPYRPASGGRPGAGAGRGELAAQGCRGSPKCRTTQRRGVADHPRRAGPKWQVQQVKGKENHKDHQGTKGKKVGPVARIELSEVGGLFY
jgi:hypothetical protein